MYEGVGCEGAIDGGPVRDIGPEARKNLHGGKRVWLRVAPDNFLTKFVDQISGMKPEETRSVQVEFPEDFAVTELAGKRAER